MSWESEVDRYANELEIKPATEGYISNFRSYATALGKALNPKSFMKIEHDELVAWFIGVRDHGISGRGPIADASFNSIKGVLKAFFRSPALYDGDAPPFKGVSIGKNRSRIRSKEDLPTDEDVSRLANALSTRNKALVLAIRYSGARPSEVLNLHREDVSPDFELTFGDTKTGDHRTVPLVKPEAVKALEVWMDLAPDNGYLFPSPDPRRKGQPLGYQSLWVAMKRAAEGLGMRIINPYALRHARATELMESPSGLRNRLMGWKTDNMARNYEKLNTADLRAHLEEREGAEETDVEEIKRLMGELDAVLKRSNVGLRIRPASGDLDDDVYTGFEEEKKK